MYVNNGLAVHARPIIGRACPASLVQQYKPNVKHVPAYNFLKKIHQDSLDFVILKLKMELYGRKGHADESDHTNCG
jgi:hypothetical protein